MTATLTLRLTGPVLFRDGRPYATEAPANSLSWPWPSTLYGALRAHIGTGDAATWAAMLEGREAFDGVASRVVGSRSTPGSLVLRGPLLRVERTPWGVPMLGVSAPADAELFQDRRGQLVAVASASARGGQTLPTRAGVHAVALQWLDAATPRDALGKPVAAEHPWWPWHAFQAWLKARRLDAAEEISWFGRRERRWPFRMDPPPEPLGIERRIHVQIARATDSLGRPVPLRTADEGNLFTAARLSLSDAIDARLVAWLDGDDGLTAPGYLTLGGDRGLAWLERGDEKPPALPEEVVEEVLRSGRFSLRLLTPALFREGWMPGFLEARDGHLEGALPPSGRVRVRLEAACVKRHLAVSGFALGRGAAGRERPARRAAPAGSVYFLRTCDGLDREGLAEALHALWWTNVSDKPDDRAAGFGLAALGVGLAGEGSDA